MSAAQAVLPSFAQPALQPAVVVGIQRRDVLAL
jgi:hypothetical protein